MHFDVFLALCGPGTPSMWGSATMTSPRSLGHRGLRPWGRGVRRLPTNLSINLGRYLPISKNGVSTIICFWVFYHELSCFLHPCLLMLFSRTWVMLLFFWTFEALSFFGTFEMLLFSGTCVMLLLFWTLETMSFFGTCENLLFTGTFVMLLFFWTLYDVDVF